MSIKRFNPISKDEGKKEELNFQEFFLDYYPALKSFAVRYVSKETVAEDIVQDVFLRLWENEDGMENIDDISAYSYQMVRFKCIDYLRAEKIRQKAIRAFTEELDVSEINSYIEEETFRRAVHALGSLPPNCHRIFSMSLEGFKAKEIAQQMNIAIETVKKQKQIARRILREKLILWGQLFLGFTNY